MKVAIAGASGMIGQALTDHLRSSGHTVVPLKRNAPGSSQVFLGVDEKYLSEFDAVVNLAGENIAGRRWTDSQKKLIEESRTSTAGYLASCLSRTTGKPVVFINASAVGYYGNRGDLVLDESSSVGEGFLAETCKKWESAAEQACREGLRIVKLRIGVVLGRNGGALAKMLLPFQMGAGGILGDGKQYMSWIAIEDAVRAIEFILANDSVNGAVNLVSPKPVTNSQFTSAMGKVLKRPVILPAPAFALKMILGDMAKEMLLEGNRVLPKKLESAGFKFMYPNVEDALAREINGVSQTKTAQAF
jgi:uncharacterized protein (TIGR01777 family)